MTTTALKTRHSLAEFTQASLKLLPKLPQLVWYRQKLMGARNEDIGSTGWYLQQQAQKRPDKLFLQYEDVRYSYAEFNQWVNQIAHKLSASGVSEGDCVAVMFENSPELIASVFAINKIGAIAGLINHKQTGAVLLHSFNTIQPKLILSDSACHFAINFIADELNPALGLHLWDDFAEDIAQYPSDNPALTDQIQLGAICYYVFTSGTTGLPKAAAVTHLKWYKAGLAFGRMALQLKSTDIQYCALPLYHNTGLSASISSIIQTGASLALAKSFSASRFWSDIKRYQATSFVYVGELCRYLLNQPPQQGERSHKVKSILGNGLRADIWEAFQERFGIDKIAEIYGASEGNAGFMNIFNLKRTVGFSPMSYAIVKFDTVNEQPITDDNGLLQRVKKGETGLLITEVSAEAPYDGYTNNVKASEKKLLHNVFKQGDCWFNSGDLVCDQGFRHIAFVDRVGDTYRWKSENVATGEVEAQVQTLKDVIEAVVYGVKVPFTEGRAGMVSVILEQGKKFNPSEFYQQLKAKLPDYAVPLFVRLRETHERTTTFKIKRTELQQEGFQLSSAAEPIFVLIDKAKGYQPLTPTTYERILSGEVRF